MLPVRPTFTNIVNAAVLVVCLILGVSVTLQLVDRFSRRQPDTPAANAYRVGDVMPALNDYSFSKADATLLLAVRSTCGFCTKSMPFYGRLIDEIKSARINARVVAVSIDSIEVLQQYFDAHSVSPELFRAVSSEYLRIVGTPTILLVDPSGVVKDVWIGLLDAEGEAAVLSAIRHVKQGVNHEEQTSDPECLGCRVSVVRKQRSNGRNHGSRLLLSRVRPMGIL